MVISSVLCHHANFYLLFFSVQASEKLVELIQTVDRCEPRNPFLYNDLSQAFSRLVGIAIVWLSGAANGCKLFEQDCTYCDYTFLSDMGTKCLKTFTTKI